MLDETVRPQVGFLVVNKPPGPTSNRVLGLVKKNLGTKKAGHTGTLDPFAEGVLVVAVGRATRLAELVMAQPKTYEAGFLLGQSTDTLDITGQITAQAPPVPLTPAQIEEGLETLLALTQQTPPMVSALKHQGQRLYDLARRGETVPRAPRPITVYEAALLGVGENTVALRLTVSRGTYIRSFCEVLGQCWGQPVVLETLRRTRVGPFLLEDAVNPQEVTPLTPLLPAHLALGEIPRVALTGQGVQKMLQGQKLAWAHTVTGQPPQAGEGDAVAVFFEGELAGLGVALPQGLHVDRVLWP